MRLVLKRKSTARHEDFVQVWQHIEGYVSQSEAEDYVNEAVEEVKRVTAGKKAAYAWSGGKDSLALQVVMERAGIERGLMGCMPPFEFPAFMQWLEANTPAYLTWMPQYRFDLQWLADNPHYLFPANSTLGYWWTKNGTHWSQRVYYEREGLDVLILGRRYADGNYIARNEWGLHTNRAGVTQYNPLRRWPHEMVLAVCHYYRTPWPPVYDWPDGFTDGTGSWPSRQHTGSVENGYKKTYRIDPSVVIQAAEHLDSARTFLRRLDIGLVQL